MPKTITANYDTGKSGEVSVLWGSVDTHAVGTKTVHGSIEGYPSGVDMQVTVIEPSESKVRSVPNPKTGDAALSTWFFAGSGLWAILIAALQHLQQYK